MTDPDEPPDLGDEMVLVLSDILLQKDGTQSSPDNGGSLATLFGREGDALLEVPGFLYCRPAKVTAAAFHDYYEPDPQHNVLRLMEEVTTPVLLVLAGDDRIVPGLAAAVVDAQPRKRFGGRSSVETIDGADHFFRDLFGEDLADKVAAFVSRP